MNAKRENDSRALVGTFRNAAVLSFLGDLQHHGNVHSCGGGHVRALDYSVNYKKSINLRTNTFCVRILVLTGTSTQY
jgi:hypothetical protein